MIRSISLAYSSAYGGLPKEIWVLSSALFINRVGTMVLPFLALYLTEHLQYTEAAAGRLSSVYGVGSILGTYLGGRLTRRLGSIRLQVVFLLAAVPFFLATPWFQNWWALAICLLFLSLFAEGIRPASATAIADFSKPGEHTRSLALQRMAVNLAVSFGSVLGGILAKISFVFLFFFDATTSMLCAIFLAAYFGVGLRTGGASASHRDANPANQASGEQAGAHANSIEPEQLKSPAKGPAKDWMFLVYLGFILIGSVIFFQFFSTYPLYLRDVYGLSKPLYGLICAINTLLIVAAEMILVNHARHWPQIKTIAWGLMLSCVGFGMLPFGTSMGYLILSMIVITVGEMLWMPLSLGWVAQRAGTEQRGVYMGWYTMTISISFVVGQSVGTTIYSQWPDLVWYLSLLAGFVILGGMYMLNDRLEQRTATARQA